ncbi:hypothetical protein EGW08_018898 [Elysia chlorotica]|uniref:Uncharacterized protein n=1 Tax=Elysia chlorotica TaxID=188477 RepID=A0A3S1B6M7_ELYCH|nr:hypothetical protein EGW08_018898 [Elysia chlorotica]
MDTSQVWTPPAARKKVQVPSPNEQSDQSPSRAAGSGGRLIMTSSQLKRRSSCRSDGGRTDSNTDSSSNSIARNNTFCSSRDRNAQPIASGNVTSSASHKPGDRRASATDLTSASAAHGRRGSDQRHQRVSFLHSVQTRSPMDDPNPTGPHNITLISHTLPVSSTEKSTASNPRQDKDETDLNETLPFVRLRNPLRQTLPASMGKMKKRSPVVVNAYRRSQPCDVDSWLANFPQHGQAGCDDTGNLSDDELGVGMFVRSQSLRVSDLIQRFDPNKYKNKSKEDTEMKAESKLENCEIRADIESDSCENSFNDSEKHCFQSSDFDKGNNSDIKDMPTTSTRVLSSITGEEGERKNSVNDYSTSNCKYFSKIKTHDAKNENKRSEIDIKDESETQDANVLNVESSVPETKDKLTDAGSKVLGSPRDGKAGPTVSHVGSEHSAYASESVRTRRRKFEDAIQKHAAGIHGDNRQALKPGGKDIREIKKTLNSQLIFEDKDRCDEPFKTSLLSTTGDKYVEKNLDVHLSPQQESCLDSYTDGALLGEKTHDVSSTCKVNFDKQYGLNLATVSPAETDINKKSACSTESQESNILTPDKVFIIHDSSTLSLPDDTAKEQPTFSTKTQETNRTRKEVVMVNDVSSLILPDNTPKELPGVAGVSLPAQSVQPRTPPSDVTLSDSVEGLCQTADQRYRPKQLSKLEIRQPLDEASQETETNKIVPYSLHINRIHVSKHADFQNTTEPQLEEKISRDTRILCNLVETDKTNIHPDYQQPNDPSESRKIDTDCGSNSIQNLQNSATRNAFYREQDSCTESVLENQGGTVDPISKEPCLTGHEERMPMKAVQHIGCDATGSGGQSGHREEDFPDDRIHRALESLRSELKCLREQDVSLLRQLISISETIQRLQRRRTLRVSKSLSFSSGVLHHSHGALSFGVMRYCNFSLGGLGENSNIGNTTMCNHNNNNNITTCTNIDRNTIGHNQCWSCRGVAFHQLCGGCHSAGGSSGLSNGCSSYNTSETDISTTTNNSNSTMIYHSCVNGRCHLMAPAARANNGGSLGSLSLLRRQMSSPSTVDVRRQNWSFGGSFLSSTDSSVSSFDFTSELPSPSELGESTDSLHSLFASAPAIPQLPPHPHVTSVAELGLRMPDLKLPPAITENESQSYEEILWRNVKLWKMSCQQRSLLV